MSKYILLVVMGIMGCIGGYSLVFGGSLNFNPEIHFGTHIGEQIVLGDEELSSSILVYTSNTNISGYEIFSLCDINSEFISTYKNLYFFKVSYIGDKCKNATVVLRNADNTYANTATNLDIISELSLIEKYTDYSPKALQKTYKEYGDLISQVAIYKNYNGQDFIKNLKYTLGQRQYREASFHVAVIEKILVGRDKKYSSPVPGKTLSESFTKIPNSPRPYRQAYTDGIHHGWDIDGVLGEDITALDDGIIVRVVDGFNNASDFSKIVHGSNLSLEQELKNLDVLRGNQVWLKTMKGDVVFYSHLASIDGEIEEGDFVARGTMLGTMGVTGVPEVGYDDYHLHFSVMKNPYDDTKAGSYDFGDYMAWDWYARGLGKEETLKVQRDIFE